MTRNFATWSLRNPTPSIVLFLLLCIAGVLGFQRLQWKNMPDFEMGTFTVALSMPGASPTQLETEVAKPAEEAIAVLQQLHLMRTKISEGLVLIRVEFELERDPALAYFDLKNAIDRVRGSLPAAVEEPRIRQHTLAAGAPSITYAVTSPSLNEADLSWFVEDTLIRAVLTVPGVNRVDQQGGVAREIQVEVDPTQLAAFAITATDVTRALKSVQEETSGGRARLGGSEQGIRTLSTVRTVEDLASLPVTLPEGRHIRLDQIASIRDTMADRMASARLDGEVAVGFDVLHNPGTDEIKLTDAVAAVVAGVQSSHSEVHIVQVSSMKATVDNEVRNSLHMLIEGALLSVVVIWLFLHDWRSTTIGALALPLSVLPTFAVLYALNFTLNTISTLALMVVVGILVDDAIVEVENITRHLKSGIGVREATALAVTEIGPAVIATTLALVIVFVPMSFMTGFTGLAFRQFGWTAVIAVLFSLLVARLITPVLAVALLKSAVHEDRMPGRAMQIYLRGVRWCLAHKGVSLLIPGALLALAAGLWHVIPTGYIPGSDDSQTTVTLQLPPGSSIDDTLASCEAARQLIMKVPGVTQIFARAGQAEIARNGVTGGSAEVATASLKVILAPWGHRGSETQVEDAIHTALANLPGVKASVNGMGYGSKLNIILSGKNPASLNAAAQTLAQQMLGISGLAGVTSSAGTDRADLVVRPDLIRAAALGVNTEAIAETVRVATSGDYALALPKFNLDSRQINIRVHLGQRDDQNLDTLSALQVRGTQGLVPLSAVASLTLENGALEINRFNRQRHITISADLVGMPRGAAIAKIAQLPVMASLPSEVKWLRDDESQEMDALFTSVGQVLLLAAVLVYCLLIILFKNFFQPLTILSAVPLSASGALLGVYFNGGGEIDEPVLLGFVVLLGILTKNSILLTDYALMAIREQNLSETEALLAACRHRARPILMTTVAMIAGMLPLLIRWGQGDMTYSQPLAATVIGGLAMGTVLSLIGVPVVFVYVRKLERLCLRLIKR
jgi:multidrug efflux pump subunit AcrB